MPKTNFWKNWDTNLKYPYLFLLVLAAAALLLGGYYYLAGTSAAYSWDKLPDLKVVSLPVGEVTGLLQPFTLYADGYLLFEQYDTGPAKVHTWPAVVFLVILGFCIAFYTAAISTMRQIPYFIGVLLLMLFLATFYIDELQILGTEQSQTTLLIVIVLLAGLSYGFQAFWKHIAFGWRVLAMVAILLVIGAAIFAESEFTPALTAMHLVNYSSLATLLISVLFMIWVSYENVNALLWFNTQGSTPERRYSLLQFVLIAGLYLANMLLLYLRHIGYLKTDLIFANGFIILLLSVIAGFWGMSQREVFYGKYFPFRPTGAVLYLVFATILFLSIGYAFATANDPLTVTFHDLIIYTHLVYGSVFFMYILINFSRLLKERKAVYKVVYEPHMFTLFSFFLMSTVILAILVIRVQYRPYYNTKAGYYNYLGDLYLATGNIELARRYYEESDVFDINNVKANYSLATMARQNSQRNEEILFLKGAVSKRPNPKLYVRMANLYDQKEYFFEKLYVLHEGINRFPESGELYNNLALLYMQTSVTDSTEYYFNLAEKYSDNKEAVQSNRLAFYTQHGFIEPAQQLLSETKDARYTSLKSNRTALEQLLGIKQKNKEPFAPDSLEQVEDFTLFYNRVLSNLHSGDTSRLKDIDRYLSVSGNRIFYEDLLYGKALLHHYGGLPKVARSVIENLALTASGRSGYYYYALGIWMLEEENPLAAAQYFKQSKDLGYAPGYLAHGYALAIANRPQEAANALQEVNYTDLKAEGESAGELYELLQQNVAQVIANGTDADKIKYLQANLPHFKPQQVDALVQSIKEKDLHRMALLARIDYLVQKKQLRQANKAIKAAASQLPPEGELRSRLNMQQLKLWNATQNYDILLDRMENVHLTDRHKRYKVFFKAEIAAAKGRDREAAERYKQAVKVLLYDADVVTAAARFFSKHNPDEMTAYEMLLDGIIYNPYSVELQKAYALQSLDNGLFNYAQEALGRLENLLPASEYSIFIKQFERQREAAEQNANAWQQ